jgi:hypothetical protein
MAARIVGTAANVSASVAITSKSNADITRVNAKAPITPAMIPMSVIP